MVNEQFQAMAFRRNKLSATIVMTVLFVIILVHVYRKDVFISNRQLLNESNTNGQNTRAIIKDRISEEITFSTQAKDKEKNIPRLFNDKHKTTPAAAAVSIQPNSCPIMSIHDSYRHHHDNSYESRCKPWKQTSDICEKASHFYPDKDVYCTSDSDEIADDKICSFITIERPHTANERFRFHCNRNICQSGRLFVGSIDPEIGVLLLEKWQEFPSAKALERALPAVAVANMKNGFSFCLIRCVQEKGNIDQLVTFPRVLERTEEITSKKKVKKPFNINVVVLDSVSRNHFYRMLPKTVHKLSEAAAKSKLEILDFEFLQGLAPYTYTNIRALMSGTVDKEFQLQVNKTYGIEQLFAPMRKSGYKTLLQEESCWYDYWGTILGRNIRRHKLPKSSQEFREAWSVFKQMISGYAIDDYGLTHFSCIVYLMHKVTNVFNNPLKICYNSKPFGYHTLRYVQNILTAVNSRSNQAPIFSYLHANAGHDVTGVRIKVMDDPLSEFVQNMEQLQDTLTIILSDHGPKTTKYSQTTLYGRYETYDSFMFMIVPEKVQEKLGKQRMASLIKNQKSLVTMVDVHDTLMDVINERESNDEPSGLFSTIIFNRTCDSLQLVTYGVCKCRGWEKIFDDQSPQFIWLAEYAIKILNGRIKQQFSKNNSTGFAKCRNLRLHRVHNIRQRVCHDSIITTFDLVVQPFESIFLIQLKHRQDDNGAVKDLTLELWRRVSIYRQYSACKDPTVAIELCVCYRRHRRSIRNILKIIKAGNESKKTIKRLGPCLFVLTRGNRNKPSISTYDVINICDKYYKFTVYLWGERDAVLSSKFPIIKKLEPKTNNFLFSTLVKDKRKQPNIKYSYKELIK